MQLETIKVQAFKSIRELELSLRPLNILIGADGSGKSNILGVFAFLSAMVERHLQMYVARAGGVDRILHFGQKTPTHCKLNCGLRRKIGGPGEISSQMDIAVRWFQP
nr:AAA family ATPase [Chloroflexus sp.]